MSQEPVIIKMEDFGYVWHPLRMEWVKLHNKKHPLMKWAEENMITIIHSLGTNDSKDWNDIHPTDTGEAIMRQKYKETMESMKEEPKLEGWELHWEKASNELPNGVNPHAYRLGFLQAEKLWKARVVEEVKDLILKIKDSNSPDQETFFEEYINQLKERLK